MFCDSHIVCILAAFAAVTFMWLTYTVILISYFVFENKNKEIFTGLPNMTKHDFEKGLIYVLKVKNENLEFNEVYIKNPWDYGSGYIC